MIGEFLAGLRNFVRLPTVTTADQAIAYLLSWLITAAGLCTVAISTWFECNLSAENQEDWRRTIRFDCLMKRLFIFSGDSPLLEQDAPAAAKYQITFFKILDPLMQSSFTLAGCAVVLLGAQGIKQVAKLIFPTAKSISSIQACAHNFQKTDDFAREVSQHVKATHVQISNSRIKIQAILYFTICRLVDIVALGCVFQMLNRYARTNVLSLAADQFLLFAWTMGEFRWEETQEMATPEMDHYFPSVRLSCYTSQYSRSGNLQVTKTECWFPAQRIIGQVYLLTAASLPMILAIELISVAQVFYYAAKAKQSMQAWICLADFASTEFDRVTPDDAVLALLAGERREIIAIQLLQLIKEDIAKEAAIAAKLAQERAEQEALAANEAPAPADVAILIEEAEVGNPADLNGPSQPSIALDMMDETASHSNYDTDSLGSYAVTLSDLTDCCGLLCSSKGKARQAKPTGPASVSVEMKSLTSGPTEEVPQD